MSLSETSSVQITFSTPQDISDELLGGTVSFCKETGYKQNIMVLTFLWSGFLLTVKSQLNHRGLIEDILNSYPRSLGNLFPKIKEDAALKQQAQEILQHYWNNLNRDFNNLDTVEETSAFLHIASKLNSQDDVSATYLLNRNPITPFKKVVSGLQSSIYRILHQINSGIGIQYRGLIQHDYFNPYESTTSSQGVSAPKTHRTMVPENDTDSVPWGKIIAGVLIFLAIVIAVLIGVTNNNSNPDAALVVVQEPNSGAVLMGQEVSDESEIKIKAAGGSSCVVKLKTASGKTRLCFYVRAGDTVAVGVPAEDLYVYFASGDTWYGEKYLFGSRTSYSMDKEVKDFAQYTWTYTLYPVNNGNFSETPIDPEDF